MQITGEFGGLDILINNASSLGPTPLALLGDTDCEDLERALATNLLGPFRLTKALLGALAASAREGRGAVVLNVSSDAALNPYPRWGAYGASKAALLHLTRIWNEELVEEGIRFLSVDPGDMDTALHALASPETDPATLKRPRGFSARNRRFHCSSMASARDVCEENPVIAASHPARRPVDAKLLVINAAGEFCHAPRASFVEFLHAGDLVIANDAATLPASLDGIHVATGSPVEVRLAGRRSLAVDDVHEFSAIVFGSGDFRTRTEDRPAPPVLAPGDRLALGPLSATIECLLGHPRLVRLRFEGSPDAIWSGLASHGRPIQYAHVPAPLALWDVWTPLAGPPVAFEPPSAGFVIDWSLVARMRARRVGFTTITHAAGISSTGDPALDARLPFDEPYRIPEVTAAAIRRTRSEGGRIVAIGTTVVRALEHAARGGVILPGEGLATQRVGVKTHLRVVDVILSGTHEPGTSHYELLRAFAEDATLRQATRELDSFGYRTHEFGDSVMIENALVAAPVRPGCQGDQTAKYCPRRRCISR